MQKKIMMLNALLFLCCFSIGHAVENERAMRLALKKIESNYLCTLKFMNRPDVLKSHTTIYKYMMELLGMPEIEEWKPQEKIISILEQCGVSAKQLCGSPRKDTKSTIFLKLARAFNLVYSARFRLRCIELHKTAVLHNDQRSDKLLPSTIQKYLDLARKADMRSNFHKQIFLEYDTAIGEEAKMGILQERKLPAYDYVDDEAQNCKILFRAATAILKSKSNEWDTDKKIIDSETPQAYVARVNCKNYRYLSEIALLLHRWKGVITKESLELSMEFNFYESMRYHSEYLKMVQFAQYCNQNNFESSTLRAKFENGVNAALKLSQHHKEQYISHQKALECYETKTGIVQVPERGLETPYSKSVEGGYPETERIDTSKLPDDNTDSNNEGNLQLNLCLDLPGTKRLHDMIEMEPVKSKRTRLNTGSYFNDAHGDLTPEGFNLKSNNENDDLQLNLCLGLAGTK